MLVQLLTLMKGKIRAFAQMDTPRRKASRPRAVQIDRRDRPKKPNFQRSAKSVGRYGGESLSR